MSDFAFERVPKKRQPTTGSQWFTIILIIVLFIVIWIVIWIVLVQNLFGGSEAEDTVGPTPGCVPSIAPINLIISQPNILTPSVFISWNAVLIPSTPGETILGYNVYSRETEGITKENSNSIFANTFNLSTNITGEGPMSSGTEVFFAVSTVDTCGEGSISEEVSFIPV